MNTCKNCGTQVAAQDDICPNCGAEILASEEVSGVDNAETGGVTAEGSVADTTPLDADAANRATGGESASGASASNTWEAGTSASPGTSPGERARAAAASKGGMSSGTKKALIAGLVAVALAVGLIFWQAKSWRSRSSNLSAEEMALIAESLPVGMRSQLATDAESRKQFAQDLRELFAVADEARKAGVADSPEMKRQLELMRFFVVGQAYAQKEQEGGKTREQIIPKEEMDAFLKEPGQDKKFDEFMQDVQKMGLLPAGGADIPEEQKQNLKQEWARISLMHRKGTAAGLDKDPKTQLQVRLQEARLVASKYFTSDEMKKRYEVTDQEVDQYIAQHPELNPDEARKKAEDIKNRARSGEDFAKLAGEFTDEPGGKEKGGDLGWFGRGQMVKPFEEAAFGLQVNGISDVVETPFGFHVIKLEGKRTEKGKDGKPEEQVHARHVLIKTGGQSANPFAPPQSPREQAKAALEEEKRTKLLDEIVKKSKVTVAENFTVKAPEQKQPSQMQMPMPGAEPPAGGESAAPPPAGGNPGNAPKP